MSDRLCIAFYILTFAVQVCVRKKEVSFVVDVAICVFKKNEVSFVVDAFVSIPVKCAIFIPVKCAIFIPVKCSNEACGTYPGFSGTVPDSFTKSNVLYE